MPTTILLIDDDPLARRTIEQQIQDEPRLRSLAPRILHAASGEQGLAYFVRERPEVVITKLVMPGMDGIALCRSIREAPFGHNVGLLVLSDLDQDPVLPTQLEAELHATFLAKPLAIEPLADAILARLPAQAAECASTGRPRALDDPSLAPSAHGTQPPARPAGPFGATGDSGSVSERHIPRLIFDLVETGATGTLAISRGKIRKEFFARDGKVVAADSNLRQEALGTLLCNKGIIDERQLAYLLTETKARGHKMGAVLIELGWLSPEEVLECLAAQARKRIVDCLRWNEGTWSFTRGDTFGERVIEHNLDTERTVFMGLFRSATPEMLVGRFDQDGDKPIRLTRLFDKHRASFEGVFGTQIGPLLASEPSVGCLALREDAQTIIAGVDALLETGLAELGEVSPQISVEPRTDLWEASFSLERLGNEVASRFDSIRLDSREEYFGQLPPTVPTPPPAATAKARTEAQAETDPSPVEVGLRAVESSANAKLASFSPPSESLEEDMRQAVLRTYLAVHGKPLYDVLEVSPAASGEEIERAAAQMVSRFSPERVAGLALSDEDTAKLEAVRIAIGRASQVLTDAAFRQQYDAGLFPTRPAETDPIGAELKFGEAMALLNSRSPEQSLPRFEAAVQARPDQALYHAYLAWARFLVHGQSQAQIAHAGLQHALELDPDLVEAHTMRGRMAACENDAATARLHLERSLEIHPDQPETVDLLMEAYARLDDPRGAERFLRKLVATLGERAPQLRHRLWRELAGLYESRLDDRSSARVASDMAARLAPEDVDPLHKSADLNAEDPSRWRELARALATEWQSRPEDRTVGEKILELYRDSRPAAAPLVAAALVLRGCADDAICDEAQAARPRKFRLPRPLPADLLVRLGYGEEDTELELLVGLLADAGVLTRIPGEELGVPSDAAVLPEEQPAAFRQTLCDLSAALGIPEPEVVLRHPELGLRAHLAFTDPVALLCGPDLLDSTDSVELGFRLSRALVLGTSGRLAGSSRSGGDLRPYFVAAMATLRGALQSEQPEEQEAWAAIAALEPSVREQISKAGQRIMCRQAIVNLSTWTKTLARMANRLSLALCGDLLRVGRAVAEEEGRAGLDDLLAFALAPDYLDLREVLPAHD